MTSDFVFNQVYKGALKAGAGEYFAHSQAVVAADSYRKGSYKGKATKMLEDSIKLAVKNSKISKGRAK